MNIQDPVIPSIYILFRMYHRNQTHIPPPISVKGEEIFLSCLKTLSNILGQKCCFVTILFNIGRVLVPRG